MSLQHTVYHTFPFNLLFSLYLTLIISICYSLNYFSLLIHLIITQIVNAKVRAGSASQVDSGQLGNPMLVPDSKLGPSWLHFYHASQVDCREHNLCPVKKLILKISDMIKSTLLNTKITFHT